MDRPLRLGEAAALAGVSKRTIRRWAARGALDCVRVGSETRYLRDTILRCGSAPIRPRWWTESAQREFAGMRGPGDMDKRGPSPHDHCPLKRVAELVGRGRARAAAMSVSWDEPLRRKANAAVGRILDERVVAAWSLQEVCNLVDRMMAHWDPEVDDDDDASMDFGDEGSEADADADWSEDGWDPDDDDPD